MSEVKDLLRDIDQHCFREYQKEIPDKSIGRGEISILGNKKPLKLWIVNNEYQMGSSYVRDINNNIIDTAPAGTPQNLSDDGRVISKNKEYARILLENYEGTHKNRAEDGRVFDFLVKSSASYINDKGVATRLRYGLSGDEDWSVYPNVHLALEAIKKNAESILEKQKEEELNKKKAEEYRLNKQEEEAKKAEEEARRLEQERKELEAERQALIEKYSKATEFIRKQVSLRNNPVLDRNQNVAKFSNVFNGIAEVINGGPGTGKTTTMIQRLKLLIDKGDLKDFRANHEECKLTDQEIDLVAGSDNWIFFSPTQLLKKYLQENMEYEGLTYTTQRTLVWSEFLHNAVRDRYGLAGPDCPFDFIKHKYESVPVFVGEHFKIINGFASYFVSRIKEKYLKISKIDTSRFEWNLLGSIIKRECEKIDKVQNLGDLLKFLINIESVDENVVVNGKRLTRSSEIYEQYNRDISSLADVIVVLLKRDNDMYASVTRLLNDQSMNKDQEEDDEVEETVEEENDYGDNLIRITRRVRSLLRVLALKSEDGNARVQGKNLELYNLIKPVINENGIRNLGQSAFFIKYIYSATRNSLSSFFNSIPSVYKQFRKDMPQDLRVYYSSEILQYIIEEKKNRPLCPEEQSLLVGFINKMCREYYRIRPTGFEKSTHKYVDAYRSLCRPVIGVDEATDYSIIDFYGIRSFGHYVVESFTLCGDTMQMMREDGIKDWMVLNDPLIFENLEIKDLLVSYRQSKELMDLAGKIYEQETGKASPYECYLKNMDTPKPLWLESDDMEEKAEWMSYRIIEVYKNYGEFPTIAVFTKDKETGEKLKEALDDCDLLANNGMKVRVCSEDALADPTIVRIFPINEVKGMEFEVAFFYDIDDLETTSLVNRYLYVGISRAAMYLAVTSTGRSQQISDMLSKYFYRNTNWQ